VIEITRTWTFTNADMVKTSSGTRIDAPMTRLWHWIRRGLLAVVLLFLAYQLWFLGHVLWWKWVPPPRPAS
jgi:hypothetical protein